MTPTDFRRQFERWLNLLNYCRRTNDRGGVVRCERELRELEARLTTTTGEER
jgi:hypothetical protein